MKLSGIVTLLTDFGERDPYVGVVKGVILGIHPAARLVDLTHHVAPQRVLEANFQLRGAWPYFPPGTIHLCVVDPGVGSARRILCARAHDHVFLAPDNGLLTGIVDPIAPARPIEPTETGAPAAPAAPGASVRAVTNAQWFRGGEVSRTFHGRDIFAPVAARLLAGFDFADVGPVVADPQSLALPEPTRAASGVVCGEIIHIDGFGNLISNIRHEHVAHLLRLGVERQRVHLGARAIGPLVDSYAAAAPDRALAIFDSFGYLEIAVNRGDANRALGAGLGAQITIGA